MFLQHLFPFSDANTWINSSGWITENDLKTLWKTVTELNWWDIVGTWEENAIPQVFSEKWHLKAKLRQKSELYQSSEREHGTCCKWLTSQLHPWLTIPGGLFGGKYYYHVALLNRLYTSQPDVPLKEAVTDFSETMCCSYLEVLVLLLLAGWLPPLGVPWHAARPECIVNIGRKREIKRWRVCPDVWLAHKGYQQFYWKWTEGAEKCLYWLLFFAGLQQQVGLIHWKAR